MLIFQFWFIQPLDVAAVTGRKKHKPLGGTHILYFAAPFPAKESCLRHSMGGKELFFFSFSPTFFRPRKNKRKDPDDPVLHRFFSEYFFLVDLFCRPPVEKIPPIDVFGRSFIAFFSSGKTCNLVFNFCQEILDFGGKKMTWLTAWLAEWIELIRIDSAE